MPNWCENNMKVTGAAEEIARFKQTCIRPDEDDDEPTFDFNTVVPMPAILKDSEVSTEVNYGLKILGRSDLSRDTFADMMNYPWVKEAGFKTEKS